MSLQVCFRSDASYQIGSGHVMRCLTLANALHARGVECNFITRDVQGNANDRVLEAGHALFCLPPAKQPGEPLADRGGYETWLDGTQYSDAHRSKTIVDAINPDIVVVDHYAIDHQWHREFRPERKLVVIDDLADRIHDCDLLVDQNFGRKPKDYLWLVPSGTPCLTGPDFALLRSEFRSARARSLERRRHASRPFRILVSMGGADVENASMQILSVLESAKDRESIEVTIVLGRSAPHAETVRAAVAASSLDARLLVGVSDMANLLVDMDVAIGAAGGSVWERCCLGLPSLLLSIAENQKPAAAALAKAGIAISLGDFDEHGWGEKLLFNLERLRSGSKISQLNELAASLVDGRGAMRVVESIFKLFASEKES